LDIGAIWNLIILSPMINVLVVISKYLFSNFGLAIIVLTIIVRAATLPLTRKQLHSTQAMQSLQPKLAELQKKYAKDKQKLAQEQMRLYKESGISPSGCMVPMLVQMPIWIALFQSIIRLLAVVPEDFLNLSHHLYSSWGIVFSSVPLESNFLWLDLATPDRFLLLPILVGGTMWLQQKMVTTSSATPQQHSQSQLMLWMMPLMFAFLTMQFPSGLALYWVVSNLIQIGIQYRMTGWGGLRRSPAEKKPPGRDKLYLKDVSRVEEKKAPDYADVGADIIESEPVRKKGQASGGSPPVIRHQKKAQRRKKK